MITPSLLKEVNHNLLISLNTFRIGLSEPTISLAYLECFSYYIMRKVRNMAAVAQENLAKIQRPSSRRGPKPRLSREIIVKQAIEMLVSVNHEDFTLAVLAKQLNSGVMSLYTYFPNRDALLDAVAEEVFSGFEPPANEGRWQDVIMEWLWATQRLIESHPVVLKVIFWDEHHSPAWLRAWWLPIAQLFKAQGMDNKRLALTMSWFSTSVIGMIGSMVGARSRKQLSVISHIDSLEEDQHRLMMELWLCLGDLDPKAPLEFGFRNILQGLEKILGEAEPLPTIGVESPGL